MAQAPSKTEWTNQTKAINDLNRNLTKLVKEVAELNRIIRVEAVLRIAFDDVEKKE